VLRLWKVASDAEAKTVYKMPSEWNNEGDVIEAASCGFQLAESAAGRLQDAGNVRCPGNKFIDRKLDYEEVGV
jgi:hypothetical protein